MADDVVFQATPATPATGERVVADEITSPYSGSTGKAQAVKLLGGAANSTEVIEGTAANGLEVDVTRVAGTVTVGDGGSTISIDDGGGSITVDGSLSVAGATLDDQTQASAGLTTATTAYTLGDTLGNGWTFTSMATSSGGHGYLRGISFVDISDVMEGMLLYFFKESVTFGTDNAAPSISDADAAKMVAGPVAVSFADLGGARVGSYWDALPYFCTATSLFVYATTLSANAVFAGGADSLKLTLHYSIVD